MSSMDNESMNLTQKVQSEKASVSPLSSVAPTSSVGSTSSTTLSGTSDTSSLPTTKSALTASPSAASTEASADKVETDVDKKGMDKASLLKRFGMVLAGLLLLFGLFMLGRYLWDKFLAPDETAVSEKIGETAKEVGTAAADAGKVAADGVKKGADSAADAAKNVGVAAADAIDKGASTVVKGISVTKEEPQEIEVKPAELGDETVPWFQRELSKLPAMDTCEYGKYGGQPFPYDPRNDLYDAEAYNRLAATGHCSDVENLHTLASIAEGDSASEIYAKARPHGIGLLNRGAIRDPEKMLPRAKEGDEKLRKFQVGASIADIQKRLPKTTDLLRMARQRPSGLSFQIPREKPPLYSSGINCERRAQVPPRANNKDQLFCINPIDTREYYDYRPHPLLDAVISDGSRYAGGISGTTGIAATSAAGSSAAAAAGSQ